MDFDFGGGSEENEYPDPIEWFSHAPPGRIALFVLASVATIITNCIGWKHMFMHYKAGLDEAKIVVFFPEVRKKVMYQIFWLIMISWTAYLSLLLPKTRLFLEFLNASYEAWALLGFLRLLIDLMGGRLRTLRLLENRPPQKLMSVMPCCCLHPCDRPRVMTPSLMAICRVGALQASVIRPLLSAVNLFIQLKGGYQLWRSDRINLILNLLQMVSKMSSVYFIFVMYGSSAELLVKFNARLKFILLRLMFIPFIVQASLLSFVFLFLPTSEEDIFPPGIAAQAWQSCLVSIEVLPLAVMVYYAYPVHEFNIEMLPPKLDILHHSSSQSLLGSPSGASDRSHYQPINPEDGFDDDYSKRKVEYKSASCQVDYEIDIKPLIQTQPTAVEQDLQTPAIPISNRRSTKSNFGIEESPSRRTTSLHYVAASSFFSIPGKHDYKKINDGGQDDDGEL